jgi:hypothetical protein
VCSFLETHYRKQAATRIANGSPTSPSVPKTTGPGRLPRHTHAASRSRPLGTQRPAAARPCPLLSQTEPSTAMFPCDGEGRHHRVFREDTKAVPVKLTRMLRIQHTDSSNGHDKHSFYHSEVSHTHTHISQHQYAKIPIPHALEPTTDLQKDHVSQTAGPIRIPTVNSAKKI